MMGMIKKDLLMIKNNYKMLIITFILFIFYSFMFEVDMSFFLPFMGLMVCISTINYDEYNHWHTYAISLPQGRINVVKSKYLTTIGLTLVLAIISFSISFLLMNSRDAIKIDESFSAILGELLAIIFMMSVLFPVLFKFGYEKGRMAMILIGVGMFGIVYLFQNLFQLEISTSFLSFLETYLPVIFIVLSVVMLIISYFISKKIYLKREF